MIRPPFTRRLLQIFLAVATLAFRGWAMADTVPPKNYRIAVIPKGTNNIYWTYIHGGAAMAARQNKVQIIWKGTRTESERDQQIQIIRSFIRSKVDAIVLAPNDQKALVAPVSEAVQAGIPVILIDSSLESDLPVIFVATDNRAGGRRGADQLIKAMGGKGDAALLRYEEGSASTTDREEGFLEEMAARAPGIKLVSTNRFGGVTQESTRRASEKLLLENPRLQGVFCSNETTSAGMLFALRASGKAGKIQFVGFDGSPELLAGVRRGEIQGLVVQDPFKMGFQGVSAAIQIIRGNHLPKRINTRLGLVTKGNVDSPAIQEILQPDTAKWLTP
jgi:ribose transport system substrate-binding protein